MPKKLIEVALPLEVINFHAAKEKSIRHGHPSTLHLWWARRPLAACRAVLFAQMVDDPHDPDAPAEFVAACNRLPKGTNATAEDSPRNRLFDLIEKLVVWKNSNNQKLLAQANELIRLCAGPDGPPPVLDPFAGGGSIPLEAQRLGLEAHASDLNPVAVLINKALIEIPPQFADQPPVNPEANQQMMPTKTKGAQGLAEDVRYYGHWMRQEAEKRIGHLYPKLTITAEMLNQRPDLRELGLKAGQQLTVIAWLWARTVPSPDPATGGAHVPLIRSYWLSKKKGKRAWLEPVVDLATMSYRFEVRTGTPTKAQSQANQTGTMSRKGGLCLLTETPMPFPYIREQGQAGKMTARLMAIVADGPQGRVYVAPIEEQEQIARQAEPTWKPSQHMEGKAAGNVPLYGMETFGDLFTDRQLTALTTFSDLVMAAHAQVEQDARHAGWNESQASRYADGVATYLAFAVDRSADAWSTIASWRNSVEATRGTFARQALPMVWDYAEANPFSEACGNWMDASLMWIIKVLGMLDSKSMGQVKQQDATTIDSRKQIIISTDPPYYDNIGYADLSDFFYVWLQRALKSIHPQLFSTLLVPKAEELVATPYRFGGDKAIATQFFQTGLEKVFANAWQFVRPDYPMTVYYAFKQSEVVLQDGSAASTGWETMLEGLIRAGFTITGTWPMRTERSARSVSIGTNALASSIVLVCRPRPAEALPETRRGFIAALKRELPAALKELQKGNIAPVDLAQASIGPGMAIFSRHSQILEADADGSAMPVRQALILINQALDEFMAEQEGEYDLETRWATAWFSQYKFEAGPYGEAETLAMAKNISVAGLVEAGIVEATGGQVRLSPREALSVDWSPATARRLTTWGFTQHCIRAHRELGDQGVARLLGQSPSGGELARELAYRLYTLCERKSWPSESLVYNNLVTSWPEILKLVRRIPASDPQMGF